MAKNGTNIVADRDIKKGDVITAPFMKGTMNYWTRKDDRLIATSSPQARKQLSPEVLAKRAADKEKRAAARVQKSKVVAARRKLEHEKKLANAKARLAKLSAGE